MRPRRAREAFWRWEQVCDRRTSDILGFEVGLGGGWEGAPRGGDLVVGF